MIASSARETTWVPADHSRGSALAGTSTLVRLIVRRDRLKLAAWLLGMTALLSFFVPIVSGLTETEV